METENEDIITSICAYAETYQIKELLKEYLKRVVLAKPKDPVQFLIDTIKKDPYDTVPMAPEDVEDN